MNTRFGEFGGQYIPEILMSEINHVAEAYEKYKNDPAFKAELKDLYANYTGRPSMLYEAKRMRADLGGPKIYLKREDLNHTGAHKINNCACKTNGKNTAHCRNGGWAAWCGCSYCRGASGDGMRNIHGRNRYGAAGAECVPYASFRSKGQCGENRFQSFERCCQCGFSELEHPL